MDAVTLLVVAVPGVLLTIGLWLAAGRAERRIEESQRWLSVRGRVVSSKISRARSNRWPTVRYAYEVRGVRHESARLAFIQKNRSQAECQAVVDRYPPGAEVDVWYDPMQPKSSVLEREGDARGLRIAAVVCGGLFLLVLVIIAVQS